MYSDPYQGSYHLRCLTEAAILSSLHYHIMTSVQIHGSYYIILHHGRSKTTQEIIGFCCPFTLLLFPLHPLLLFFYYFIFPPQYFVLFPLSISLLFSAAVPATTSMVSNPLNHLALKLESIQIDYNYLNCFTDFNQTAKF